MGNMPRVPINMQEMKYSLDIIFITQNEKVAKVLKDITPMANVTYSGGPVHYFLEVNAGEADDIETGDALRTDIAALQDNILQKQTGAGGVGTTSSAGFSPTCGGGGGQPINFYARQKLARKIDDLLTKAKVYLEGGEQPPHNEAVQTGERGGKYYESTGHAAASQAPANEPKAEVDPMYANIPEEINTLAKQLADKAKQLEPRFTHDMQQVATATGGKLHQLEFDTKSQSSIARKIVEKQHENPELTIQQVAMQLRDLNRYTLICEHSEYCNHIINAQQKLADLGYRLYDHKQKKYFLPNEPYHGYHTSVIDANGNIFELQYHTPQSAHNQLEGHKLYEAFRVSKPGSERDAIYHRMQQMWEGFTTPDGIDKLAGEMM
jgi:hypothetical protein